MADDFPTEATAIVQRRIENEHGYLSWLNIHVDTIERGRTVMTIPYDERLTNTVSSPTIYGGIAATLIDTAGGIALRTTLDDPFAGDIVIINLNVNYLRRASDGLTAVIEVVRAGDSVGVSTVTVVSTDPGEDPDVAARQSPSSDWNDAVATRQGAYRLFRE